MKIQIRELISGAKKARGLTVIIDVFRAFSTTCYLFAKGAEKVLAVGKADTAYELKEKNPAYVLVGEREGKILPGFDFGNSPSQIKQNNFNGETVILTTSAGTQGIVNSRQADETITGSFVNLQAIVKYIKQNNPSRVSLVAMGVGGEKSTPEDLYCARYIKNRLQEKEPPLSFSTLREKLKDSSGKRFFDQNLDWSPEEDFHLCLELDRFDFIISAHQYGENNQISQLIRKEGI